MVSVLTTQRERELIQYVENVHLDRETEGQREREKERKKERESDRTLTSIGIITLFYLPFFFFFFYSFFFFFIDYNPPFVTFSFVTDVFCSLGWWGCCVCTPKLFPFTQY